MSSSYPTVSRRAEHRCEYCHAPEGIFNFRFEIEHIIPVSLGGADDDSNLALACRACNLYKSDHLTGVDDTTECEVMLFHPRQYRWNDHFQVDTDSGVISGKTPEGRATVNRLRMNVEMQLEARRLWMRLEIFP